MLKKLTAFQLVRAGLVVGGAVLAVGFLGLPTTQTLFGSAALLRVACVLYSLALLTSGVLLFARPRLGCLFTVGALIALSIAALFGLGEPQWYRAVTAVWGLLWAAAGILWWRKLPRRA